MEKKNKGAKVRNPSRAEKWEEVLNYLGNVKLILS